MPVRHEAGQEAQARPGPRRLHVHEDVGGAERVPHRRQEPPWSVEAVHLQHRVDEVHQGMRQHLVDRFRPAALFEVGPRPVEPQHVGAQAHGFGPVHLRFPHHHLEVEAAPRLRRTACGRNDLDAQRGIRRAQPGKGRSRDVGTETVSRAHPHDAGECTAVVVSQLRDGVGHALGGPHRPPPEVCQLPAAARA